MQMWDVLKLLGKYEEAVSEGEALARIIAKKCTTDNLFNDKYSKTFLAKSVSEANSHLKHKEFIFFLKLFYKFLDQSMPSTLELLLERDESEVTVILSGFTMLFLETLSLEVTEDVEE